MQVPIVIDDDYKIRVLDPEQCKRTEQLADDCKTFVDSKCTCNPVGSVIRDRSEIPF